MPTSSSFSFKMRCSPKISGLFFIWGILSYMYLSNSIAPSKVSNRQTTWASSLVQSSMPGMATIPASPAALSTAGAFLQVLWSVMAIMSRPDIAAMPTILLGVMSLSPQGDRQEWMCRS